MEHIIQQTLLILLAIAVIPPIIIEFFFFQVFIINFTINRKTQTCFLKLWLIAHLRTFFTVYVYE